MMKKTIKIFSKTNKILINSKFQMRRKIRLTSSKADFFVESLIKFSREVINCKLKSCAYEYLETLKSLLCKTEKNYSSSFLFCCKYKKQRGINSSLISQRSFNFLLFSSLTALFSPWFCLFVEIHLHVKEIFEVVFFSNLRIFCSCLFNTRINEEDQSILKSSDHGLIH